MRRILLKIWRRRKLHEDLEAELTFHRAMACAQGNPIPLGNTTLIREQALDLWRFTLVENLWRDLVYAARGLSRSPVLVLSALLSLGLGIGANTAIFSLIDAIVLRMLPVERPEELEQVYLSDAFVVSGTNISRGVQSFFSYPVFRDLRERNQVFSGLFARLVAPASLVAGDRAEHGVVEMVSGAYFETLGVRPMLGRTITDSDDLTPMAHPVAVLSFHYWRERLSADPTVGKTIRIDHYPFTVIRRRSAGVLWRGSRLHSRCMGTDDYAAPGVRRRKTYLREQRLELGLDPWPPRAGHYRKGRGGGPQCDLSTATGQALARNDSPAKRAARAYPVCAAVSRTRSTL
jgi:hypothetical protein